VKVGVRNVSKMKRHRTSAVNGKLNLSVLKMLRGLSVFKLWLYFLRIF